MSDFNSTHNRVVGFVDGRIRDACAQVGRLGGRIVEPIHALGPHGFRALVIDCEGDRVALHSTADA